MKSYSQEIKLLLNEIAILSQPQQIDGKLIYEKDTLKKLRSLSARLYMLCDFSLEGNLEFEALIADIEKRYSEKAAEVIVPPTPAVVVQETPAVTLPADEVKEPVVIPESVVKTEEPVNVVSTPLPVEEPVKREEPVAPIVPPPVQPAPEVSAANQQTKHTVGEVIGSINISRRFEYINFLFGGDGEAFKVFVENLASQDSLADALKYFENNFQQRNWSRKSETASDLKKIIQNLF